MFKNNLCQMEDVKFILQFYPEIGAWKDFENILHFGCGKGFFTTRFLLPTLPRDVNSLIGIDFNSNDVSLAQSNHSHPKISFQTIDNCDDEIKETSFDRIFSIYYIDDCLNQRNIFEKFYNNFLSPTGDIVILLLSKHAFLKIFEELDDRYKCGDVNLNIFKKTSVLPKSLKDIGFNQIICKSFERYQIFPSRKTLKGFLKKLHAGADDAFFDDFLSCKSAKQNLKYLGRKQNIIAVPYQMTFVYAKKLIQK